MGELTKIIRKKCKEEIIELIEEMPAVNEILDTSESDINRDDLLELIKNMDD